MKIKYENTNVVTLGTLNSGDLFQWDDTTCMKLNYCPDESQKQRIVTLVCGDVFTIPETAEVIPLKGILVINNDPTNT